MAQSYAQYKKSLETYQETLDAIRLRAAARQLVKVKTRLTMLENAQASAKEQKRHEEAMARQDRTKAIQEHLRSRMNNRWA